MTLMNLLNLTHPQHRRRLVVFSSGILALVIADIATRRARPVLHAYNLGAFDNEDFERKPEELQQMDMPDVVLMGSSRARYAFVPDAFEAATGCSAYNLGVNGAQTVEWLVMARQLFAERKPRLVVLGVNAGEFRADYQPNVGARFLFTLGDILESFVMEGFSRGVLAPYIRRQFGPSWAAYEQRQQVKMWWQEQLEFLLPYQAEAARSYRRHIAELYPPEDREGTAKGYWHPWIRGLRLHEFGRSEEAAVTRIPRFSEAAVPFARFDQFLGWLQDHGIPVVVGYIPNSPKTEGRWVAIEPRMILTIEFLCRARGVPFLRSDQADLPRENTDYLDEVHVGWPLARRMSRRMAEYVEALGVLESRTETTASMLRSVANDP